MARQKLLGGPLQTSIIDRAHYLDWHVAHFSAVQDIRGVWRTPAKADGRGWPDLVFVRDRLFVAEVKGDGDRLRDEQKLWLQWLTEAGIENYVWGPKEWFDGTIDRILA